METKLLSSMKSLVITVISGLVVLLFSASGHPEAPAYENQVESHSPTLKGRGGSIRPWKENPSYWQYRGNPVLLLGASNNDNLFQEKDCLEQLERLAAVGGNYIRNTMSDRDSGNVRAFAKNPDGKYDLEKWNEAYWNRFEGMLKRARKLGIIVQIEIWDRFDHTDNYSYNKAGDTRDLWQEDPYNPGNNINYKDEETNFAERYDAHPGSNKHIFFLSVPELQNCEPVLKYQQSFVLKLLSLTLKYDNVLYCLDNETSGKEEWATYWAKFLREHSEGKTICITEMWDDWNVTSDMHKRTIDHPELYDFVDLSQNSHNTGHRNWTTVQAVLENVRHYPRPVNSTKVYGCDKGKWNERGINTDHAIRTVCRNIMGGFASSRFHRPYEGLGLSEPSLNCIRAIREIEAYVKIWELDVVSDLTTDEGMEAYLRSGEGKAFLLYLPMGGKVDLEISDPQASYTLRWIDTDDAQWRDESTVEDRSKIELDSRGNRSCFALIVLKD